MGQLRNGPEGKFAKLMYVTLTIFVAFSSQGCPMVAPWLYHSWGANLRTSLNVRFQSPQVIPWLVLPFFAQEVSLHSFHLICTNKSSKKILWSSTKYGFLSWFRHFLPPIWPKPSPFLWSGVSISVVHCHVYPWALSGRTPSQAFEKCRWKHLVSPIFCPPPPTRVCPSLFRWRHSSRLTFRLVIAMATGPPRIPRPSLRRTGVSFSASRPRRTTPASIGIPKKNYCIYMWYLQYISFCVRSREEQKQCKRTTISMTEISSSSSSQNRLAKCLKSSAPLILMFQPSQIDFQWFCFVILVHKMSSLVTSSIEYIWFACMFIKICL